MQSERESISYELQKKLSIKETPGYVPWSLTAWNYDLRMSSRNQKSRTKPLPNCILPLLVPSNRSETECCGLLFHALERNPLKIRLLVYVCMRTSHLGAVIAS